MKVEYRGRITSLNLLVTLFIIQPRKLFAFWAASRHYWLNVQYFIHYYSQVLFHRAALNPFLPTLGQLGSHLALFPYTSLGFWKLAFSGLIAPTISLGVARVGCYLGSSICYCFSGYVSHNLMQPKAFII